MLFFRGLRLHQLESKYGTIINAIQGIELENEEAMEKDRKAEEAAMKNDDGVLAPKEEDQAREPKNTSTTPIDVDSGCCRKILQS